MPSTCSIIILLKRFFIRDIHGSVQINPCMSLSNLFICSVANSTIYSSNQLKNIIEEINSHLFCRFYYKKGYEEFLEFGIIDSELEDKLLYNLALCSSVIKNYNDALMYIEKLESIVNLNEPEMYTNLILKASIFIKINRNEEAIKIYKEILIMI